MPGFLLQRVAAFLPVQALPSLRRPSQGVPQQLVPCLTPFSGGRFPNFFWLGGFRNFLKVGRNTPYEHRLQKTKKGTGTLSPTSLLEDLEEKRREA